MNYYLKVLQNYATFTGRASRSEYWYFILFNLMFGALAAILDNIFGIAIEGIWYGPIYAIYGLAMFIPGLAVLVRRLHDTGRSGWFFLIVFIPLIGFIWLLVLLVTGSNPGDNRFGPNPHGDNLADNPAVL